MLDEFVLKIVNEVLLQVFVQGLSVRKGIQCCEELYTIVLRWEWKFVPDESALEQYTGFLHFFLINFVFVIDS